MKHILAIIILVQFTLNTNAQSYIGVSGSVNSSGYAISTPRLSLSYDHVIGWGAGIPVEINLSDKFNLSSGLKYTSKGSSLLFLFFDITNYEPKVRINYLEIPILLKGKFNKSKMQFNPIAGFSLGYGITGTNEYYTDDNGIRVLIKDDINFENEITRFLCQLHIGLGATINFPKSAFAFDIQYLNGINNLSGTSGFPFNYSLVANGFELTAGYLIKIGKEKSTSAPAKK